MFMQKLFRASSLLGFVLLPSLHFACASGSETTANQSKPGAGAKKTHSERPEGTVGSCFERVCRQAHSNGTCRALQILRRGQSSGKKKREIRRTCEQGETYACLVLGFLQTEVSSRGIDAPPDAERYFERGCTDEIPEACTALAALQFERRTAKNTLRSGVSRETFEHASAGCTHQGFHGCTFHRTLSKYENLLEEIESLNDKLDGMKDVDPTDPVVEGTSRSELIGRRSELLQRRETLYHSIRDDVDDFFRSMPENLKATWNIREECSGAGD